MVVIVGALSDSHIPVKVARDLLNATKPGQNTVYILFYFIWLPLLVMSSNYAVLFCTFTSIH